jgi:hypothetical protein
MSYKDVQDSLHNGKLRAILSHHGWIERDIDYITQLSLTGLNHHKEKVAWEKEKKKMKNRMVKAISVLHEVV